jgi:hypothetical protein
MGHLFCLKQMQRMPSNVGGENITKTIHTHKKKSKA